jgi:hypothetical protein
MYVSCWCELGACTHVSCWCELQAYTRISCCWIWGLHVCIVLMWTSGPHVCIVLLNLGPTCMFRVDVNLGPAGTYRFDVNWNEPHINLPTSSCKSSVLFIRVVRAACPDLHLAAQTVPGYVRLIPGRWLHDLNRDGSFSLAFYSGCKKDWMSPENILLGSPETLEEFSSFTTDTFSCVNSRVAPCVLPAVRNLFE